MIVVSIGVLALGPTTASAAPPGNDNFANATVVSSVPFMDALDITEATTEANEPQPTIDYVTQSVWYAFTPSSLGVFRFDASGSDYWDTAMRVYQDTGGGLGGLQFVTLWDFNGNGPTVTLAPGTTYYLQAGKIWPGSGTLHVNIQLVPPPANDDFADATAIGSLPFSDTVDTTGATYEPGEPWCNTGYGGAAAWYSFTPTTTGSVSATSDTYYSQVAVYTGPSLYKLTSLGCQGPWGSNPLTIHVDAGTTYYYQVSGGGQFTFSLDVAPTPQPNFWWTPSDPTRFDTVQFYDQSFDPGGVYIESVKWSFGDGATSTEVNPTHRYAVDGDYTVTLEATTHDGRTGTTSQVVPVHTHDVAISKLTVPQSASSGQTRSITVGLSNTHYPETVEVQLFKSTLSPNDPFELVGTLRQSVPVRSGGRTTNFAFTYTFTANDAVMGKVTFKAVATIVDARDYIPADNTTTSLPTRISR
jgi:PKD repeat protein